MASQIEVRNMSFGFGIENCGEWDLVVIISADRSEVCHIATTVAGMDGFFGTAHGDSTYSGAKEEVKRQMIEVLGDWGMDSDGEEAVYLAEKEVEKFFES